MQGESPNPLYSTSKVVSKGNNKNQVVIFKAHLQKKIKQDVLDEDEYIKHLEKIVERDFFPDLRVLRAKRDLLEAEAANDQSRVRDILLQYQITSSREGNPGAWSLRSHGDGTSSRLNTEGPTSGAWTPLSGRGASSRRRTLDPAINPEMDDPTAVSLDKYLAKFTSEDNVSFSQILEEAEKRRRLRMAWCYEREEEILRLKQRQSRNVQKSLPGTQDYISDTRPALLPHTSSESLSIVSSLDLDTAPRRKKVAEKESSSVETSSEQTVEGSSDSSKALAVTSPSPVRDFSSIAGLVLASSTSVKHNERFLVPSKVFSKQTASWEGYQVHNPVFFVPDGVPLSAQEEMDAVLKRRTVHHENTRFKRPLHPVRTTRFGKAAGVRVPGMIRIGPDGKEIQPHDEDSLDSSTPFTSMRPADSALSFVASCPSPMPGAVEFGDASPLMTWGAVEATPYRLDPGATPLVASGAAHFKMQNISEREQLAHQLADKVGQQHRARKMQAVEHMRSQLLSPGARLNTAGLSPAARRLLSVSSGRRETSGVVVSGKVQSRMSTASSMFSGHDPISLRASYTPTVKVDSGSRIGVGAPSPRNESRLSSSSDLTSDLINLMKTAPTSSKHHKRRLSAGERDSSNVSPKMRKNRA